MIDDVAMYQNWLMINEPHIQQCAPCCRKRGRRGRVYQQRRGYIIECTGCGATWMVIA